MKYLLIIFLFACQKSEPPPPQFTADFETVEPEFFYYNCQRSPAMSLNGTWSVTAVFSKSKPVTMITKKSYPFKGNLKWTVTRKGEGEMKVTLLSVNGNVELPGEANGEYFVRVTVTTESESETVISFDDLKIGI